MAAIEKLDSLRFHGILDDKNVSAVSFWNQRALVVTDEITDKGNVVQALEKNGDDFHAVAQWITVLDVPGNAKEEMDLEGIAVDGQTVFVLGSHSSKRKKVKPEEAYENNRKALLSSPEADPRAMSCFVSNWMRPGRRGRFSELACAITSVPPSVQVIRHHFQQGNGIDAEAAVWNQRLYIRFPRAG
jgi:hypothetical protein